MRAILVIDMLDDMRIEDTLALNVTLYNGMFVREVKMNRHLKPLPNRKGPTWDRKAQGWNECLKEITDE